MTVEAFEHLRCMAELIQQRSAPIPAGEELNRDWDGAVFDVLGTRCVVNVAEIRALVGVTETIPLPGVKPWVRGLANVGGRVVAMSDLTAFLSAGKQQSKGKQALIINGRGIHTGLLVETCYGGVRLSTQELDKDKVVTEALQPFVSGVFTTSDGDYALFETERLLTDADFVKASVITTL